MSDYYSFSTEYGAADKFFQAVLSLDKQRVERLKAQGVSLTENVKQTLINGGGSMVSNKPAAPFWYLYLTDLEGISKEGFVYISHTFFEETGAQLYYSESLVNAIGKYFYNSAVFNCLMECYNLKKLNKKKTMHEIIRKSRVDLLKICVNEGWLSQAKKRDELIEYAQMNNQVECTAWLMDFKNRTADFAAEREKAEKKMMRELNADPNSVGELKKIWTYKKQDDGTLIIMSYKGSATVVTIPEKIGNDTVTAIGEYALSPSNSRAAEQHKQIRRNITKIIIPNTVKCIESTAFDNCRALEEINIPNGIAEIKTGTFQMCSSLKSIILPDSVTKIGNYAFSCCETLENINIPSKVTEIGKYAFFGCEKMKSFEIPESVKSIGRFAFSHCQALKQIKLPHGITTISENTFSNCFMLESIEIPDTVEEIGEYAFYDCDALKRVDLPNNVQNIGRYAFGKCYSLETITLPPSIKQIKNQTHSGSKPETIFDESPNVTAIVEPKSYAERYCKRNEIPYKYAE